MNPTFVASGLAGFVPLDRAEEVVVGGFGIPGGKGHRQNALAVLKTLGPGRDAVGGVLHLGRLKMRGCEAGGAGLYPLMLLLPDEWLVLRRNHALGEPPVIRGSYDEFQVIKTSLSSDSAIIELTGGRRLRAICSGVASAEMVALLRAVQSQARARTLVTDTTPGGPAMPLPASGSAPAGSTGVARFCSACGQGRLEGAAFCPRCGTRFPA